MMQIPCQSSLYIHSILPTQETRLPDLQVFQNSTQRQLCIIVWRLIYATGIGLISLITKNINDQGLQKSSHSAVDINIDITLELHDCNCSSDMLSQCAKEVCSKTYLSSAIAQFGLDTLHVISGHGQCFYGNTLSRFLLRYLKSTVAELEIVLHGTIVMSMIQCYLIMSCPESFAVGINSLI